MFNWIRNRRLQREIARLEKEVADQKAELKLEQAQLKLEQALIARGVELKEALIEAGIHPIKRVNRNLSDKCIFMYGILNGRLIRAEMGVKGYLLLNYIKEE